MQTQHTCTDSQDTKTVLLYLYTKPVYSSAVQKEAASMYVGLHTHADV